MSGLSRRHFVAATLSAGGLAAVAGVMSRASGTPKTLTADTGVIEVNGKAGTVFRLFGPDRRPGLSLAPGERFHTELVNRTGVATTVHWHGQTPPWKQDGVPWPQTPAIRPGATATYITRRCRARTGCIRTKACNCRICWPRR